jgi:hypothetical protein
MSVPTTQTGTARGAAFQKLRIRPSLILTGISILGCQRFRQRQRIYLNCGIWLIFSPPSPRILREVTNNWLCPLPGMPNSWHHRAATLYSWSKIRPNRGLALLQYPDAVGTPTSSAALTRPSETPIGDQGTDRSVGSEGVSHTVGSRPWPPLLSRATTNHPAPSK